MAKKVKCCTILNRLFRLEIAKELYIELKRGEFTSYCMGFAIFAFCAYIACWVGFWTVVGLGYETTCPYGEMKYVSEGLRCVFANDTINPNFNNFCNYNQFFIECFLTGIVSLSVFCVVILSSIALIMLTYEVCTWLIKTAKKNMTILYDFGVVITILLLIASLVWLNGVVMVTGAGYDTRCIHGDMKYVPLSVHHKRLMCVFANGTVDFNFNVICNFQTYNSMINGCLLIGILVVMGWTLIVSVLSIICIMLIWLIRKYQNIKSELCIMDV
uniref:Uncharacterized protein n=1 Tax=Marseillevirus LCMAC102 TaxID=2506603 RepID=A0A481YUX2_9VIRU|nr:MAG: hypothetical protein LCMAC102_01390 [Marseillevirus LCMAC102]